MTDAARDPLPAGPFPAAPPGEVRRRRPRPPGAVRAVWAATAAGLVSVPVNAATTAWASRVADNAACNAPLTWAERLLGLYLPLAFAVVALGGFVGALVVYGRGRGADPKPVSLVTPGLALVALLAALASGWLAVFAVGWIGLCF